MITFNELNEQNHKILELSNVMRSLIKQRLLCDNMVVNEIFFRYVEAVRSHLDVEDKHLYAPLLADSDQEVNNTARKFVSGSGEIKRIFDKYVRRWSSHRKLRIKDHDAFVQETQEICDMIFNRIQDETEKLYPMIRKVKGDQEVAA